MMRRALRALQFRHSFTCSSHEASPHPPELPRSTHATALPHRALVRVAGSDASKVLQGLVTADVSPELPRSSRAQYCMMLNVQGRVLYDVIMYHTGKQEQLLECDSGAANDVVKHLRRYALRSEVQISLENSEYNLWAAFPGIPEETNDDNLLLSCSDPRVHAFCTRLILKAGVTASQIWDNLKECETKEYHEYRLRTGIPEGTGEIPPGNCFPLEYNLDYTNGISFSKGCYLGQELTARTHHTGVVRKRVMPIELGECPPEVIPTGTTITTPAGKSAGKLICHQGVLGLALLRLMEVVKGGLSLQTTQEHTIPVSAHTPSWWPT